MQIISNNLNVPLFLAKNGYLCGIMSEFEPKHAGSVETPEGVDFSRAVRLERNGGSCDCFKTKLHRRTVFVKRLKEEFLYHPRYVGAFDKEYDLGVDLNHPALPEYREYHDHYIVMDYIDGKTLADMIASNDSWLKNDANIRKMIGSLIDVVDYLHQRDVVHCDIKADNVMITNGNRNLKLIDLGNAYTDWFADTSGNPGNYKLSTDDIGNPEMDFRGIGNIIRCLSDGGFGKIEFMSRFRSLCSQSGVTADILRDELAKSSVSARSRLLRPAILIVSVITLCLCTVLLYKSRTSTKESPPLTKNDTIYIKPVDQTTPKETTPHNNTQASPKIASAQSVLYNPESSQPPYEEIINTEMKAMVNPMLLELDKAQALVNDPSTSVATLRKIVHDLNGAYCTITEQAYPLFKKRFPDVGGTTIELAVANSPAYQSMLQRYTKVSLEITDRIFEIQNKGTHTLPDASL